MIAAPKRWTASIEGYLRTIYGIAERSPGEVTTTALADSLGVGLSSVSGMVRKLSQLGLVTHLAYQDVHLTPTGLRVALAATRRHRLLELFLAQELGLDWDEVHDEASALEHAVSDRLIDAIAARLGDPTLDPHGDPIPTRGGDVPQVESLSLAELEPGARGEIVRVRDSDPELLRYLSACDIGLGSQVEVVGRQPFGGPVIVRVGRPPQVTLHTFGEQLAAALSVRVS